jgi:hypothetical protein
MVATRQTHLPAEPRHRRRDAQVVGGDDDARDRPARSRAPVHVLDHRTAVQVGERLSGKARRSEAGGNDGDDLERMN